MLMLDAVLSNTIKTRKKPENIPCNQYAQTERSCVKRHGSSANLSVKDVLT